MDVRGEAIDVDDLISRKSRVVVYKRRIETRVQSIGLDNTVESHSEPTTEHKPAAEFMPSNLPRTPRKTELRAEVCFLRRELTTAGANAHVGETSGPAAKHHSGKLAVFLRNCAKVFPAQTGGQSQIGRSEERRVGKESRSRGWRYHDKEQ